MSTIVCQNCETTWAGPGDLPTTCPVCGQANGKNLPVGYREAWDAWDQAVRRGASQDELRGLWAEVNRVLDGAGVPR